MVQMVKVQDFKVAHLKSSENAFMCLERSVRYPGTREGPYFLDYKSGPILFS